MFKQQFAKVQKTIDELRHLIGDQSVIASHNVHFMKIAIQVQRDYWGNLDLSPKQEVLVIKLMQKYSQTKPEAQAIERVSCSISRKKKVSPLG
ncbi:hypothetical protein ACVBEF_18515 [Glaciimonas sp. GG7]